MSDVEKAHADLEAAQAKIGADYARRVGRVEQVEKLDAEHVRRMGEALDAYRKATGSEDEHA